MNNFLAEYTWNMHDLMKYKGSSNGKREWKREAGFTKWFEQG